MKIQKIETYPLFYKLSQPYGDANGYKYYRSCYLIRIITESGVNGWGECVDWLPTLDIGFKERIIPFLIGKKVTDRLKLVGTVKKWHQRAASAVSMALTEIVAKYAHLSVCELWGGSFRSSIPVYASFQSYSDHSDWIRHSLKMTEESVINGLGKIKVKIGGRVFREDLEHIEALQKTVGEEVEIILDANQSYDLATSRKWERCFSKSTNFLWLEEPMPMDQVQDYQILRSNLSIPVAGGENIKSTKQFIPLLTKKSIDIIQPDIMHENGIDDFFDTLKLARHFGIRVSPHSYDGVITRLYTLFCLANLKPWSKMGEDAIEPAEWDVMENPFSEILPVKPVNGKVCIPQGEGIGVEVNMDLIKKYLWDGSSY
jgi:D-galactarolactone cycloisomerase